MLTTCPWLQCTWSGAAGTRTCDLSVAGPTPYPLRHHANRQFEKMHRTKAEQPTCITDQRVESEVKCTHKLLDESVVDEAGNAEINVADTVEYVAAELLRDHISHLLMLTVEA